MGFTFLKKLPTPNEIRTQYPIDAAIQELKAKRDQKSVMFSPVNLISFLQSSAHVLLTMKTLCVIIFFVCAKCRTKLLTRFLSFHEFIQINHVPRVKVTKEWFISLIRKKHLICLPV